MAQIEAEINSVSLEFENLLESINFDETLNDEFDTANSLLNSVSNQNRELLAQHLGEINSVKDQLDETRDSITNESRIYNDFAETRASTIDIAQAEVQQSTERINAQLSEINNKVLIARIIWAVGISCVIAILVIILAVRQRSQIIARKASMGSKVGLDDLLASITSRTEFLVIRLDAIKAIYNYQSLIDRNDINKLKKVVKKMESLKSSNDVKATSKLREVVESLEMRLMERR